jgi:CheY-like chemotaxis protein
MSPSLRVLVVEDHGDTRMLLVSYLESLGHAVVAAGSVMEARQALQEHGDFDLMLSDIGLPDGLGWELLESTTVSPGLSVAMSGFGARADIDRSLRAGFAQHLVKPLGLPAIDAVLAAAVKRRHAP